MSEIASGKGRRFRQLHQCEGAFIMPNPFDVGTARILASLGFEALATTSAGMAFALGKPEGRTSKDEVLTHCRMMVLATDLPVSADLEKGFADSPEAVADTIRAAAAVGLAGCSIEDHTNRRDDPIFSFDLAVERIHAAVEACQGMDQDFVLTARAENFLWDRPDLDDTIARLQAFEKVGADVLYAPGLHDLEVISTVCAAVDKPVNVIMGMPGVTFGIDELTEAGVKRISVGSALARSALGAFLQAGRKMAEKGTFTFADNAAGFDELQTIFSTFEHRH